MKKIYEFNKKIKICIDNRSKSMLLYVSVSTYIYLIRGCGGTGRRAGLRNQCQRRGGSSPLIRTK